MSASALFFSREGLPPLRGLMLPCGSVWFVGIDAFALVGCTNVRPALRRIAHQERRQIGAANLFGLHPHTQIISERALAQIVQSSQKGAGDDAARWVCMYVIPTVSTLHRGTFDGGAK